MEEKVKILSHNQFKEVFNLYYRNLCSFSELLTKDSDNAQEVVQTVFLVIWENRNRIEVSKDIKSYLFRSVYNQSLNFLKRQKLELKYREMLKVIPPDYDQHILAEIEARELESILESKIRELSNAVKEVFFLSRVDGLKNKEIAEKLNISVKTVEGRITKALFVLRTTFDDYSK